MNSGWQIKRLDELYEIARGGSPRPIKNYMTTEPDGINWIKISDATASTKYIYETKEKIRPEGIKMSRLVHEGDFILSNSMSFGRPYIMKTTGCIHDGWLVLHAKTNQIDNDYMYYLLGSDVVYQQFDRLAAGSTVRNLNSDLVRGVTIPVPPLPEQQRIVAVLDEAFAGIAAATVNAKKNLQNARELFESHLQSIFTTKGDGWVDSTIEKHIKFIDYRGKTPQKTDAGLRLITAKNLKMGYLQREPQEFVHPDSYDAWMVRGIPEKGDVLFTTEAPLGNVAQLDTDEKVVFAQRIIIMQPKAGLDKTFLKYLLLSAPMQQKILEKGTGATVKGIKASLLKKIDITFPPLPEQQRIVTQLDTLSTETKRLEAIYQQKLDNLAALKQSILQKAFAGELPADRLAA